MKDKITILTIITYGLILMSVSILINDIREFDLQQFKNFQTWADTADKNENWFTSENAIKWSFYIISAGLFFWRGYLIYAFSYFLFILDEVGKGNYFSTKIINYFKKIGSIFIWYTVNVVILRFILAATRKSTFNFFVELRSELTFLIPAGLAFYILAEIFERAKKNKEENDLTI